MAAEALFATAYAAGAVEGADLLRRADRDGFGLHSIVPAALYGLGSLPLSVIGAAPGAASIAMLPLAPPMKKLEKLLSVASSTYAPSVQETQAPSEPVAPAIKVEKPSKTKRRVDLLREENKKHLTSSRTPATSKPSTAYAARQYLATLDGQPLATPLAEAMRRTRFLLVGAGLAAWLMALQRQRQDDKQKKEHELQVLKQSGKDPQAIQRLLVGKQGAALRLCKDSSQLEGASRALNTIPLFDSSNCLKLPQNVTYWNPGSGPDEWKRTPLTSDWMLGTARARLLVIEMDSSSLPSYFDSQTSSFSSNQAESQLLAKRLASTAVQHRLVASSNQVVRVILGNQASSVLSTDVILSGHKALSAQLHSTLERLLEAQEDATKANGSEANTEGKGGDEIPNKAPLGEEEIRKLTSLNDYLQFSLTRSIAMVDTVGSSIRFFATWTATKVQELYDRITYIPRAVHVLSDQPAFVNFLKVALPQWRIVWYRAENPLDVEEFGRSTAISMVYCGSDAATTGHILELVQNKPFLVGLFQQDAVELLPEGVTKLSIQDIHNSLFQQVRDLLSEGKTTDEVQELVNLIQ